MNGLKLKRKKFFKISKNADKKWWLINKSKGKEKEIKFLEAEEKNEMKYI